MTTFSKNLLPYDGEAYLDQHFYRETDANNYFAQLDSEVKWEQKEIKLFGKKIPQPRLMAWHGDKGITYEYSNLKLIAKPWTPTLIQLKNHVEDRLNHKFNAVFLNYYRNGHDYMGWHRDNEKVLGLQPLIVSISLGAKRIFKFRHYTNKENVHKFELENGSLMIMKSDTQNNWSHSLPKSLRIKQARINLTFRNIIT